jgi:hypothetical protein
LLDKAIEADIGVLERSERADRQIAKVEVVTSGYEGAELCSITVAGRRPEQRLAAGVITIVAAKHRSIEVERSHLLAPLGKAAPEVSSLKTASPGVHINLPWFKIGPGVGITAKEANGQVIAEPVIDTQAHSARSEIVALSKVVVADVDT